MPKHSNRYWPPSFTEKIYLVRGYHYPIIELFYEPVNFLHHYLQHVTVSLPNLVLLDNTCC